jgi:hypothetical protein
MWVLDADRRPLLVAGSRVAVAVGSLHVVVVAQTRMLIPVPIIRILKTGCQRFLPPDFHRTPWLA